MTHERKPPSIDFDNTSILSLLVGNRSIGQEEEREEEGEGEKKGREEEEGEGQHCSISQMMMYGRTDKFSI